MTNQETELIRELLHALDEKLTQRHDRSDVVQAAILVETKKTNGRVTKLEYQQQAAAEVAAALLAREKQAKEVERQRTDFRRWIVPVAVSVCAVIAGIWQHFT